jgi:hypothetical protein
MIPEGVKTEASDRTVTANYVETHIKVGIEALKLVRRHGRSVKHLRFESDFDGPHGRAALPNGQGRNRHVCPNGPCPLCPDERTSPSMIAESVWCQTQTSFVGP